MPFVAILYLIKTHFCKQRVRSRQQKKLKHLDDLIIHAFCGWQCCFLQKFDILFYKIQLLETSCCFLPKFDILFYKKMLETPLEYSFIPTLPTLSLLETTCENILLIF